MLCSKDMIIGWAKIATILTVSQWLTGNSLLDSMWHLKAVGILLGFTVYQLITIRAIPPGLEDRHKELSDDIVRESTIMIIAQLMIGAGLSNEWLYSAIAALIGFIVYHISIARYVQGRRLTGNYPIQLLVDDWAKFGTMMIVSRLISFRSLLDIDWIMSSLSVLLGFSVYDMIISHITDKV